jgi:hypothetical protein
VFQCVILFSGPEWRSWCSESLRVGRSKVRPSLGQKVLLVNIVQTGNVTQPISSKGHRLFFRQWNLPPSPVYSTEDETEWSSTSIPPLCFHGLLKGELYLLVFFLSLFFVLCFRAPSVSCFCHTLKFPSVFVLSVYRPSVFIMNTKCHNVTTESRRLIPIMRSTPCAGE